MLKPNPRWPFWVNNPKRLGSTAAPSAQTYQQNLSATQSQSLTLTRAVIRGLAAIQSQVPVQALALTRTMPTATQNQAPVALDAAGRIVTTTQGQQGAFNRRVGVVQTAQQGQFVGTTGIYDSAILGDGPTSFWKCNESSGTTLNDSGTGGNPLSLTGSGITLGAPGIGDGETAVVLNSSMAAATPAQTLSGTWSVEMWVKLVNTTTGTIFSTRTGSDHSFDIQANVNAFHGDIGDGTVWLDTSADISVSLATGVWYYLVYVVTPTGVSISINAGTPTTGSWSSAVPLLWNATHTIGVNGVGSGLSIALAKLAAYNYALTPTQIANHYAAATATVVRRQLSRTFAATQSQTPIQTLVLSRTFTTVMYDATVLADLPTYFWPLNEASGTTANDRADSNNGTYQGTPGTNFTLGQPGIGDGETGVLFDGSAGWMISGNTISSPGPQAPLSVESWFKTTSSAGGFMLQYNSGIGSYDRHLYIGTDGKVYFGIAQPVSTVVTSTNTYNDGNWHHAVGVLASNNNMLLYVDGVLVASNSNTSGPSGYSGKWNIGNGSTGGWTNAGSNGHFPGTLAKPAVYAVALTPAQISNHFQAGGQRQQTTLAFTKIKFVNLNATQGQTAVQILSDGRVVTSTNGQAGAMAASVARGLSTSQAQTTSATLAFSRNNVATQTQVAVARDSQGRTITSTQGQVGAFTAGLGRALAVSQAQGTTTVNGLGRTLSTTQAQSDSIAFTKIKFVNLNTTQGQTAVVVLQNGLVVTMTQGQTGAFAAGLARSFSTTQAQSVSQSMQVGISQRATQTQTAVQVLQNGEVVTSTQGQAGALAAGLARSFSGTQSQSPTAPVQVNRKFTATPQSQSASQQLQVRVVSTSSQSQAAVLVTSYGEVITSQQGQAGASAWALSRTLSTAAQTQTDSINVVLIPAGGIVPRDYKTGVGLIGTSTTALIFSPQSAAMVQARAVAALLRTSSTDGPPFSPSSATKIQGRSVDAPPQTTSTDAKPETRKGNALIIDP